MIISAHERRPCHLDGITYGNSVIHTHLAIHFLQDRCFELLPAKELLGSVLLAVWRQKNEGLTLINMQTFPQPPVCCLAPRPGPLLCLVPLSSMPFVLIIREDKLLLLEEMRKYDMLPMKLQGPGHPAAPVTELQSIPVFSLSAHSSFSELPGPSNPCTPPGFPEQTTCSVIQ